MAIYQNFRALYNIFDVQYKGYYLNMPISRVLYDIVANPKSGYYRPYIRFLFKKYNVQQLINHDDNHSILFNQGIGNRQDKNRFCDYINQHLEGKSKSFYSQDLDGSFSFHPLTLVVILIKILTTLKRTNLSIWQKLDIYARVMPFCNTIEDLERVDFSWVKTFVVMIYPMSLGALLTQYFKNRGVKTIALADGIFFNYGENAPYDAVNYSNFISDKLIFWGAYSKREYENLGISSDRLFVGGYPKPDKQQSMKAPNRFIKCSVLLARTSYDKSNLELLEVLSMYSQEITFYLKLHPSNDVKLYRQVADSKGFELVDKSLTLDECISKDNFDFAIAVNTTAYYEALIKGIPCLRYRNSQYLMMKGYDDDFHTVSEFETRLNSIKSISIEDYQESIQKMLMDTIGLGINNYTELILQ